MSGYAKTIAEDLINQMASVTWPVVAFTAEYHRMYLTDLEQCEPAGGPSSSMQLVIAPVEERYERTGWGGVRITVTLGLLFDVQVQMANKEITDANIDAYEQLVDDVCTWLVGPRKFAAVWCASEPVPIFGDHYNEHLYEKEEFHVPVLVDFFCDVGAS